MVFLLSGCCIFSRWSWMQLSGMEEILRDSGEIVRWTEAGLRIDLVQFHIAIFSASSFLVCCALKTAETDSREKILVFSIYERNTQEARLTPEIYVCGCVRPHLVSSTEFTSNFTFLVCQNTCHVKAEAQGTVREPESTGAKTPWLITWRWCHKLRDTSQNTYHHIFLHCDRSCERHATLYVLKWAGWTYLPTNMLPGWPASLSAPCVVTTQCVAIWKRR